MFEVATESVVDTSVAIGAGSSGVGLKMARSDPPCVCDRTNGKTSANAEHSTTRNPRDVNFFWTKSFIAEDVTALADRAIRETYP